MQKYNIDTVIGLVSETIDIASHVRTPSLPAPLILINEANDGISQIRAGNDAISDVAKYGAFIEPYLPSGSINIMNQLVMSITKAVLDELMLHSRVEVAISAAEVAKAVAEVAAGDVATAIKGQGKII